MKTDAWWETLSKNGKKILKIRRFKHRNPHSRIMLDKLALIENPIFVDFEGPPIAKCYIRPDVGKYDFFSSAI